jgi:hypothetical protein
VAAASAGQADLDVLDVRDRFVEQMGDVIVVQVVDDAAPVATSDHEPEMAKQSQLVRDRRRLHFDRLGQLAHAQRARAQPAQDPHPARRGQRLHGVGDCTGEVQVKPIGAS